MFRHFLDIFRKKPESDPMKYLIVGLGNIGPKYYKTRHNIGFQVLDAFAEASNLVFEPKRYGDVCKYRFKGRSFILVKPSTYVNLSGKTVNYWMQKENIPISNVLIILDDLALDFGTLRLRPKGGDAGHNGLKHIQETLGHQNYARLRFGIGNEFSKGQQVDFVLGKWSSEEETALKEKVKTAADIIKAFGTVGLQQTMNQFNKK